MDHDMRGTVASQNTIEKEKCSLHEACSASNQDILRCVRLHPSAQPHKENKKRKPTQIAKRPADRLVDPRNLEEGRFKIGVPQSREVQSDSGKHRIANNCNISGAASIEADTTQRHGNRHLCILHVISLHHLVTPQADLCLVLVMQLCDIIGADLEPSLGSHVINCHKHG